MSLIDHLQQKIEASDRIGRWERVRMGPEQATIESRIEEKTGEIFFLLRGSDNEDQPIPLQLAGDYPLDDLVAQKASRLFFQVYPNVFQREEGPLMLELEAHGMSDVKDLVLLEQNIGNILDPYLSNAEIADRVIESIPADTYKDSSISVRSNVPHNFGGLLQQKIRCRLIVLNLTFFEGCGLFGRALFNIKNQKDVFKRKLPSQNNNRVISAILGSQDESDIQELKNSSDRGDKISVYIANNLSCMGIAYKKSFASWVFS